MLSLRRVGYAGEILALSRSGRFNEAHLPSLPRLELEAETALQIRSLSQLLSYLGRQHALGRDWRAAIDALRPYTAQIWQQFPPADQLEAVRRWSSTWSLHRHSRRPERFGFARNRHPLQNRRANAQEISAPRRAAS